MSDAKTGAGQTDLARLVPGEDPELLAEDEEEGEDEAERPASRLLSAELGLGLCRSRLNQPAELERPW